VTTHNQGQMIYPPLNCLKKKVFALHMPYGKTPLFSLQFSTHCPNSL